MWKQSGNKKLKPFRCPKGGGGCRSPALHSRPRKEVKRRDSHLYTRLNSAASQRASVFLPAAQNAWSVLIIGLGKAGPRVGFARRRIQSNYRTNSRLSAVASVMERQHCSNYEALSSSRPVVVKNAQCGDGFQH